MGCFNVKVGMLCFFTNSSPMKNAVAPLSLLLFQSVEFSFLVALLAHEDVYHWDR